MVALGQSAAVRTRSRAPTPTGPDGLRDAQAPWPQLEPLDDEHAGRRDALARAIENTVLPRLVLTHGSTAARHDPAGSLLTGADVATLHDLLIADDHVAAAAQVAALLQRGTSVEAICLDLFAPAARQLGEDWEVDRCDFSTVTLALLRLQHMVRDFGADFVADLRPQPQARHIMLAGAPGEQHSLGLDMLAGFFRRAGWQVCDPAPRSAAEFAAVLRREAFHVVGISAACEDRLDAVAGCIRAVRQSPRNRAAGIMVGGPIFVARPDFVPLVGADATATDGAQAVLQAERMLSLMTHWG